MAKLLLRSFAMTAAIAACCGIATTASAQEPPSSMSANIPTAIDEIFFGNSGPYPENRTLQSELNFILGLGGFPEHRVLRDATAVHKASVYLLNQQSMVDPTIRVPDLFNPYQTSVQFLPASQVSGQATGSEFVFE